MHSRLTRPLPISYLLLNARESLPPPTQYERNILMRIPLLPQTLKRLMGMTFAWEKEEVYLAPSYLPLKTAVFGNCSLYPLDTPGKCGHCDDTYESVVNLI